MLVSQYLDKLLGLKSDLKVHFKHSFSADIEKFMDKSSDYTFYHAVTQNAHTKLSWSACNFKEATKEMLKLHRLLHEKRFQFDFSIS